MWFSDIRARAFGPLRDAELEFVEGLNIVHGPNESGKSTWHAALTMALCGKRRGSGRTKQERVFKAQHRPWTSMGDPDEEAPWQVRLGLMSSDGRHLEIDRELADNQTEVRDRGLGGRELPDEVPIVGGSPDGALLLGLDRETFPMTASVRQASILSDLAEPDALQKHLARAAAGSTKGTASEAIEGIKEFKKENVGLDRSNSTKPLRAARNAVDAAERDLIKVRSCRDDYLELVQKVKQKGRQVAELEARRDRAVAERDARRDRAVAERDARNTKQKADALMGKVEKLQGWARRFSGGDPSSRDLSGSGELASALGRVDNLPAPANTNLEPAEVLETRLADLDRQAVPQAPELTDVQKWVTPLRQPAPRPPPLAQRTITGPLIAGAVGLVAAVAVGVMSGPVYGVVVAGLASVTAWSLVRKARPSPRGDHGRAGVDAARAEARRLLDEWGLPHDPDAAVEETVRRSRDRGALSAQRDKIVRELQQRRELDEAEASRVRSHDEAWAKLRALVLDHGVKGSDDDVRRGAQEVVERLDQAQDQKNHDVAEWGRYQEALGGRSRQDWQSDADRARREADEARDRLDGLAAVVGDTSSEIIVLDGEIGRIEEKIRTDRDQASRDEGRLMQIDGAAVDVAAAEARLRDAAEKLERVERLQITLDFTLKFLEQAADKAHRLLAPKLKEQMSPWIPKVTGGSYAEVEVDPENLDVALVSASGDRRDARLVSRGTTEQVYLVLRLVLAQVLSADYEKCPVLLDDPTVHADAKRKIQILEYLLEAAADHQVIVFSQEEAVAEWARENLNPETGRLIELVPVDG